MTGVIITAGRTAIERLTYSVQLKFKRHIGYLKNNMSCEKHDLDLDLDAHNNQCKCDRQSSGQLCESGGAGRPNEPLGVCGR